MQLGAKGWWMVHMHMNRRRKDKGKKYSIASICSRLKQVSRKDNADWTSITVDVVRQVPP